MGLSRSLTFLLCTNLVVPHALCRLIDQERHYSLHVVLGVDVDWDCGEQFVWIAWEHNEAVSDVSVNSR